MKASRFPLVWRILAGFLLGIALGLAASRLASPDALARLLRGLPCRVNLIRFHAIPDSPLRTSGDAAIAAFQARLQKAGITTTLRASRGEDILAACGLLAGKGLKKNTPNP